MTVKEQIEKLQGLPQDQQLICLLWQPEDIQGKSDTELTDKQVEKIMDRIERYYDCNIGVNWEVIDFHIGEVV